MPIQTDWSLSRFEDGSFVVSLVPQTPIGGWPINFTIAKRFGSQSGFVQKSVASGYNGASGITILNSGLGQFSVSIDSVDTSGLTEGNYASWSTRLSSGGQTILTAGMLMLTVY